MITARWMVDYSMPTAFKFSDATKRWGETDAKDETAFSELLRDVTGGLPVNGVANSHV
jgi:hypothetical protein